MQTENLLTMIVVLRLIFYESDVYGLTISKDEFYHDMSQCSREVPEYFPENLCLSRRIFLCESARWLNPLPLFSNQHNPKHYDSWKRAESVIVKISLSLFQRRSRHVRWAVACLKIIVNAPLALGLVLSRRAVHLPFIMPPSTRSSSDQVSWNDMTIPELKSHLKGRSLPVSGVKAVLIQRLDEHQSSMEPSKPASRNNKSKYFNAGNGNPPTPLKGADGFGISVVTTPIKPSTKKKRSPSVTPERIESSNNASKRESPAKGESTSPRKRVKIEPGSLAPPDDWERIYELVEELRSDRSAPCDTDGGEALPEKHLGPKVYRFQVLTALMLSSQTKDAVVGETMRALQKHGLTVENIKNTDSETLNLLIGRVGFHNNKTKFMKQAAEMLISQYNGDIPPTAEEMMTLPGVGPKMAYIVESIAFGTSSGIGVDTHMHRLFNDLKWVNSTTPEQTREQLEGWLPKHKWGAVNLLWVGFGQEVQQQKEKMLRKILGCSKRKEAIALVKKLRLDVNKEAKRFGMEDEIQEGMDA